MDTDRTQEISLRLGRPDFSRLAWALGISLALHLVIFGGYEAGKKFDLWKHVHWPRWLQPERALAMLVKIPEPQPQAREVPLMFVNVNPSAAIKEAPKNARYYSDKNAEAANPEADKDTDIPKISGKQTQVVRTEDSQKSKFDKLQPDFAQLQQQKEAQEESKPKPAKTPGDLVMAKPDVSLRQDDGFTEHSRPRTIKEAMMRNRAENRTEEKMKQDGGVSRNKLVSSLDTQGTPLGLYDAQLIDAVQQCWDNSLENTSALNYQSGRVVLQFRLHANGTISDLIVVQTTVNDFLTLLCKSAISTPGSPPKGGFGEWPRDMRLLVGKDYRDISFTFFYN